jgi:hypothetical protein
LLSFVVNCSLPHQPNMAVKPPAILAFHAGGGA